jgi:phosphate-selective porin OprO and OprP
MNTLLICLSLAFLPLSAFAQSEPGTSESDSSGPTTSTAVSEVEPLQGFNIPGPVGGLQVFWDDGLRIENHRKYIRIKVGGKVMYDLGSISSDDELDTAFPDLDGGETYLRRLQVYTSGTLFEWLRFKIGFDLSGSSQLKDAWISHAGIPFLGEIKVGIMKEPFSLATLTSSNDITFMERSLPAVAMSASRNPGILCRNAELSERLTWAAGVFWALGSYGDTGDTADSLQDSIGMDLTARVTGLPYFEDNGSRLLHLGLSYSHQFRDEERDDSRLLFRSRPESYLTNDRLVDTDPFFANGADLFDIEGLLIQGPLSFQGELYYTLTNAGDVGNPNLWGGYLNGSYFLTGESRAYNFDSGTPGRDELEHHFRPFKGEWGAVELALRFSYLDLNDKEIRGGKEANLTAGVNLYLTNRGRVMFNYIRANVKDRANPSVDSGHADIFMVRLQVSI